MVEIEVKEIPPLEPAQESLLEMHSMLNIMNILMGELQLMDMIVGPSALVTSALEESQSILDSFEDLQAAIGKARAYNASRTIIQKGVEDALSKSGSLSAKEIQSIQTSCSNIKSALNVLEIRAHEIVARSEHPGAWQDFPVEDLRHNFVNFLAAVEKNSRGRYRIIYNVAYQEERDYVVHLTFESALGGTIRMPAIFQDVIRDLVANARKYTAPGGTIEAGLAQTDDSLILVVSDTGRGIPENELEKVVIFGFRSQNVSDIVTRGGGFGLTKAFWVTRQFGGRMWIRSEVGVGTRIKIVLPLSGKQGATDPQA